MDKISCSTFFCDRRGGRFCCAFCPDPCKNRCLNHPDRCKLAASEPTKERFEAHRLTKKEIEGIERMILEGKYSVVQIAKRYKVNKNTVYTRKKKLFERMGIPYGTQDK